jgi:ubiquitin-like protein ATG12
MSGPSFHIRSPTDPAPIPDEEHEADLPLTMNASVVLTSLPHDAHTALAAAGTFEKEKGNTRPTLMTLPAAIQPF